jgi:hypothetical protein
LYLFLVDPVQDKRKFGKTCNIFFIDVAEDHFNDILELFGVNSLLFHLFEKKTFVAELKKEVIELWKLDYQRHVVGRLEDYVEIVEKLCLEVSLRDPFEKYCQNRRHLNL